MLSQHRQPQKIEEDDEKKKTLQLLSALSIWRKVENSQNVNHLFPARKNCIERTLYLYFHCHERNLREGFLVRQTLFCIRYTMRVGELGLLRWPTASPPTPKRVPVSKWGQKNKQTLYLRLLGGGEVCLVWQIAVPSFRPSLFLPHSCLAAFPYALFFSPPSISPSPLFNSPPPLSISWGASKHVVLKSWESIDLGWEEGWARSPGETTKYQQKALKLGPCLHFLSNWLFI